MNLISSFMNIILRTKEKLGFKLSEKEDLLILLDDTNKVLSILLRMERLKEKMKTRIKPNIEHEQDDPDVERDEYVKMSPESYKAKIQLDQSDDNIRLYIR